MSPRLCEGLKYRGLVVILDGVGDRPSAALGGRTPLEAAHTPNLDRLAAAGMSGMVDPLLPGMPVGTHTGSGALLGLPPRLLMSLARGPVEAAGIGLDTEPGDVLMRCNFATLEEVVDGFNIVDRRAGRIREGTQELAAALKDMAVAPGISATLRPASQHRAVLRLSADNPSPLSRRTARC